MRRFTILVVTVMGIVLLLPSASARKFSFGLSGKDTLQEAAARPKPLSLDVALDFKTQHVWNGRVSYDSWNLQPWMRFTAYGFFVDAWACVPLLLNDKDLGSEVDLSIGYNYKDIFEITYIDFYYPLVGSREKPDFFKWDRQVGNHQNYALFQFYGVEKFPVELTVGAFTFGDTREEEQADGSVKLVEQYSMYIGLGYTHTLKSGQTLSYEVGGTPYKGFFYHEHGHLTNIRFSVTQPFRITDSYTLPLKLDLVINPAYEKVYFVASVGLF